MLKSMFVILAILGSVVAQASPGVIIINAIQDQKAVGAATNPLYQAVQDQKTVSLESQVETAKLLDLNEGF